MFKLSLSIALRYTSGRNVILTLPSFLSFLFVFFAVSALVLVLSIFNGFQSQIKKSIFNFDPHIVIETKASSGVIKDWKPIADTIQTRLKEHVLKVEPMIQSAGLVRKVQTIDYIFLRGIDLEDEIKNGKPTGDYVLPDDFPRVVFPRKLKTFPKGDFCFIGREMAYNLNVNIGDSIEIIVPRGQFSLQAGVPPKVKKLRVAGLFKSGHYNYDTRFILLSLDTVQKLYGLGKGTQQVVLRLKDLDDADFVKYHLERMLPLSGYYIHSVQDDQKNFFAALQLEKTLMTVIVSVFLIFAIIVIAGSSIYTVQTKRKDIGILKAIGVPNGAIAFIFMFNGFIMGCIGTFLGLLNGYHAAHGLENLLLFLEKYYNQAGEYLYQHLDKIWIHQIFIPKNIYYLDSLPVSLDPAMLVSVGIAAVLGSTFASMYPALMTMQKRPIDIIRKGEH